jgi:hypothetical protein
VGLLRAAELAPARRARPSSHVSIITRVDMTYLGMQVLIEGLALAAFGLIRNMASEPLARRSTPT